MAMNDPIGKCLDALRDSTASAIGAFVQEYFVPGKCDMHTHTLCIQDLPCDRGQNDGIEFRQWIALAPINATVVTKEECDRNGWPHRTIIVKIA